jgi:hypothetical protein
MNRARRVRTTMRNKNFEDFLKKQYRQFVAEKNVLKEYLKRPFLRQNKEFLALKETHKNQRCFIVALGPSLTLDDLNKLQNEVTFSMNSILRSFDKTKWRPTYYAITDSRIIDQFKDDPRIDQIPIFFTSSISFPKRYRQNQIIYTSSNASQMRCVARGNFKNGIHISKRLGPYINDAPTSVQALIQIAIFMGFSKIYLIGQDCNYGGVNAHSILTGASSNASPASSVEQSMLDTFSTFKHDAEKRGVQIINCTRGGMLEIYERQNLDEVLANK